MLVNLAAGTRRINMGVHFLPIANYPQFILNEYQEEGQKSARTRTATLEKEISIWRGCLLCSRRRRCHRFTKRQNLTLVQIQSSHRRQHKCCQKNEVWFLNE